MAVAYPWGPIDPNSQHQRWSRWTFTVYEGGRTIPLSVVQGHAAHWLRLGFGSVGQAKVEHRLLSATTPEGKRVVQMAYVITCEVEGVDCHDPGYVANVRQQFQQRFVAPGWGPLATSTVAAELLAGDAQDGRPAAQLLVMPTITRDEGD